LRQRSHATLLTPHPGEAARLLGSTTTAVQADRAGALAALVSRYGCGIVLKGAGTLVQCDVGPAWRNTTGNPGMAAPGMGDVLTGIVAALHAQGLPLAQAAMRGVQLHGAAGDALAASGTGPLGLTAGEVARHARKLLNEQPDQPG